MQVTLELQTFRFWCTARSVRHGYNYGTDIVASLTEQQKLEEIDYQINNYAFSKPLLNRFKELRAEVTGKQTNELTQPAKTAS